MPYAKLFRSRWAALLWAGGILWTAVDFVGVAPRHDAVAASNASDPATQDANGMPVNSADLATLANAMGN
ncbi:hypothetical protein [Sphingomonas sp. BAUL-RG-20F-R05-02]|uniref:hypothetical protein n=1 Tax=Sphingomonas sp. BAUL-RG-20F-R05-02 TaxID=2914830 RepID=UPI001F5A76ED|nr:hypothetical protein [Sphingomonas sp. BAUL-RG-20F-R05-02]